MNSTSTTSWSSARAGRGSGRRLRPRHTGRRRRSCASRCWAKAHTVMAEGGVAAALANVETRDNWQVHFRDTMRGGKFLNQWRMAQLHAQEAPERVRELRRMGRGVRPHEGRPHPAAEFRRAYLSAAGARRRSHRPGDDPHAARSRRAPGHRRLHGVHDPPRSSRTATASPAASAICARAAGSSFSGPRRSCWRRAASAAAGRSTSNSWEYTADGHAMALLGRGRPDRHGVRAVPSDRAWSGRRACAAR